VNEFGGPALSHEFEEWCRQKLKQITGNTDTTLPRFLITLKSEQEIREYTVELLGAGPLVQEFIAGFMQHRDFNKEKVIVHSTSKNALPLKAAKSSTPGAPAGVASGSTFSALSSNVVVVPAPAGSGAGAPADK